MLVWKSVDNFGHCVCSLVLIWVKIGIILLFTLNFVVDWIIFSINWISLELLGVIVHLFNWPSKVDLIANVILDIDIFTFVTGSSLTRSLWNSTQSTIVIWSTTTHILTSIHQIIHFLSVGFFVLLYLCYFLCCASRGFLLLEWSVVILESRLIHRFRIIRFYISVKR